MYKYNQTLVTEFLLLGFQELHDFRFLVFTIFLMIFFVTVLGNLLIVSLATTNHSLRSPMYFFLSHLSLSDLFLIVTIMPKMLHSIINDSTAISLHGCISQLYFFGVPTIFDCFLLTSMSYDRYLAICKPLHYGSIMTFRLRWFLVIFPWSLGISFPLLPAITVNTFHFCRANVIDHFFCDLTPLLNLSCSDTSVLQMEMFFLSIPILPLPLVFIIVTYACITLNILRISSNTGKQKAFSTCSSHLIVVCTYYGSLLSLYLIPSGGHLAHINKLLSLLYTVMTPLCNPIIYSFRNGEIRIAFMQVIYSRRNAEVA